MTLDPDVATVLEWAPGFAERYLEMVAVCDGDPGAPAVFGELADYVAQLAEEMERTRPRLVACMAAVEAVAVASQDAEELVGWSFLDALDPADVRRVRPWMGPQTAAIHRGMDRP